MNPNDVDKVGFSWEYKEYLWRRGIRTTALKSFALLLFLAVFGICLVISQKNKKELADSAN